ncbi:MULTISPECIES: hypothetical protein [unclassified Bradyrhizobium]|uniref:hypothetical protein n=1 Tax=unclassified Bradyrhizobium TaxID=2631580 RepID=UPI001FF79AA5|nr:MULTISPECIES: hypothetical protein [unclassified Bradyrhizobium]
MLSSPPPRAPTMQSRFNPSDYPPGVQKALRYANADCDRQDGGAVTFAPDTVRRIDLTGDGRDHYIVDFSGHQMR